MRADVLDAVRTFFRTRGYLEVETPVRVATPALEQHIDAEPSGQAWLRTSPELHMKRLLAGGLERIFQIGPCFRRGERGALHHPEYSMLEWYRTETDAEGIREETRDLLAFVAGRVLPEPVIVRHGAELRFDQPWEVLSVRDLFREQVGWDPHTAFDGERFDLDLVDCIEPRLPRRVPVALTGYPAERAGLARIRPGHPPVAERWELYLAGIEIANAYTELTDADEQERRFREWAEDRRAGGREVYPLDEPFLDALRRGLPACGGIALGIDRLVMLLTGADSLDAILPFRDS